MKSLWCLGLGLLSLQLVAQAPSEPITFGAVLPVTGPIAAYGIAAQRGMEQAINEFNSAGGLKGRQVVLRITDDEFNVDKAVSAFNSLAQDKGVSLILGSLTSRVMLSLAPLAQDRSIALITPSATNDALTNENPWFFRSCYQDSWQGRVLAKYALETLKARKFAILLNLDNAYSIDLAKEFQSVVESGGGKWVDFPYSGGRTDFSEIGQSIAGNKADVVFFPDYYSTVAQAVPGLRDGGFSGVIIGPDGWDEIANQDVTGLEGSFYTNHWHQKAPGTLGEKFVKSYQKSYGETPNLLAALGYDAARVALDALKAAGSGSREDLRSALEKTDGTYLTGKIRMQSGGRTEKTVALLKLLRNENDALTAEFAGTIDP